MAATALITQLFYISRKGGMVTNIGWQRHPSHHNASHIWILADNTLWDGWVIDEKRQDAQTNGVRAFNDLVRNDERVEEVILPLRDGLTIIRKK